MFSFNVEGIRVRYADTDQMGYVYYGNYAKFYEIGRVEAFRSLEYSYREMEESGVMMPVYEMQTKFHSPAKYDDLLTIVVKVPEMPRIRAYFEYEIYNQDGTLLNTGSTTLVFQNMSTGKLCMCPSVLLDRLKFFYSESWIAKS